MTRELAFAILLLALAASGASAQNTTNPNQPYDRDIDTIVLYHLDEGEGTTVVNVGPQKLEGVLRGPTWSNDCKFGSCLEMDGDDYIEVPHTLLFESDDLTYEAWIYLTAHLGEAMFLIDSLHYTLGTAVQGRLLAIDSNRRPFAFAARPGALSLAVSKRQIPLNQWVHLSAVFDEDPDRRGVMHIAIDGEVTAVASLGTEQDAGVKLSIGGPLTAEWRGLIGRMDEVRVSSTARDLRLGLAAESFSWGNLKARW